MQTHHHEEDILDFIVIGAAHSGLRWLTMFFEDHPSVNLVELAGKLPKKRPNDILEKSAFEISRSVTGAVATSFCTLPPDGIRVLHREFPRLQIVVILRNPIERAWADASAKLTKQGRRLEDISEVDCLEQLNSRGNRRRGDYEAILQRWREVFGRENVFVSFADEILANPSHFVSSLCGHLRIETDITYSTHPPVKAARLECDLPRVYYEHLVQLYRGPITRLAAEFGSWPARWLEDLASKTSQTHAKRVGHLPDFIGIGAQKAGTTWLYYNLKSHSGAFLPSLKELHHFDRNFHLGLDAYKEHFTQGALLKKGEITPAYSILPRQRIKQVYESVPSAKFIFLVRNPVDRAWSHAMMSLVRKTRRSFNEVSDAEFMEHFLSPASIRRGDYVSIIENWLEFYPREQLFIGCFDDIVDCPKSLLTNIFRFLELSIPDDWNAFPYDTIFLKGSTLAMPEKYKKILSGLYRDKISMLASYLGPRVFNWNQEYH